jgi:hypothetical protein
MVQVSNATDNCAATCAVMLLRKDALCKLMCMLTQAQLKAALSQLAFLCLHEALRL